MLIVFGSINLDLIFQVPALPGPGQTLLAQGMRLEPGGKGANQAMAAALEGAPVRMVGAVGEDVWADLALAGLKRARVDLRVTRLNTSTGLACICTQPRGENQIVVAPGANLQAQAAQVEDAELGPDTLLLLQMETDPGENAALLRRARARGCRTLLNLAPGREFEASWLSLVDIWVVNEEESAFLGRQLGVGADALALQGATGGTVIRTLGAAGVQVASPGEHWEVPAPAITPIDTTAAGDCFVGVLAAALEAGRPLREAVARAVVAGSLCCTRMGSQGSLPSREEIETWMSGGGGSAPE